MTPQWHDTPPYPGLYVARDAAFGYPSGTGTHMIREPSDIARVKLMFPFMRWFGPVPADPQAQPPK